eukprot:3888124-Rhodomonas_salina.1
MRGTLRASFDAADARWAAVTGRGGGAGGLHDRGAGPLSGEEARDAQHAAGAHVLELGPRGQVHVSSAGALIAPSNVTQCRATGPASRHSRPVDNGPG